MVILMIDPHAKEVIASFYRIRQALGVLGILFPLLLLAGSFLGQADLPPAISDYYHTLLRDLFVGCLFAIGMFLLFYKGHKPLRGERFSDDVVTSIAGFGAVLLALFPNEAPRPDPESFTQSMLGIGWTVRVHYLAAQLFLFSLAYMCLVKFTRTESLPRRRIYRTCGWAIIAMGCLATAASIFKVFGSSTQRAFVHDYSLVLWAEAIGIWAFGCSWLVKGRADSLVFRSRQS